MGEGKRKESGREAGGNSRMGVCVLGCLDLLWNVKISSGDRYRFGLTLGGR
jgi:hypothetical protein